MRRLSKQSLLDAKPGATTDHFVSSAIASTTAPQDVGLLNAASFDVYRRLRADILNCHFMPGDKLRFQVLRDRYEAGVGTLREALSHLVAEGFVRTEAGYGFRVSPASVADMLDITEWRVEFETKAIADAIRHGDDQWEVGIITAFHMMSKTEPDHSDVSGDVWAEWAARHERFHGSMVAACSSPWLLHFRAVLFHQAARYRRLAFLHNPRPRHKAHDHREMMEAVLARDARRACELTEQHIRQTIDTVLKNVPGLAALGTLPSPKPARNRQASKS